MDQGSIYIVFGSPELPEYIFTQQLCFPRDSYESYVIAKNILDGKDATAIFIENKLVWANAGLEFKVTDKYKSIMEYIEAYYDLMKTIKEEK
jgi:hypothetical protein